MNKKIKILDTDSILDIISKIELESEKNGSIYLEVENNNILKNFLNLKFIIHRFYWKKICIVTNDKDFKKIWEKLGIKYFYKNDDIEFEESFSKTHILRYNFTFFEYLFYEIKKLFLYILFNFKKRTILYKNKKVIKDTNFFFLVIWLIVSLSLLSFIFYFAVPKTYIYIIPELSIKTVSRNVVYSEKENTDIFETKNVILVKNIKLQTIFDYTFRLSSIDPSSAKKSYWPVEIFNELNQEQILKPNTRFVTDDWIVFRSTDWIKIPPSKTTEEWQFQIGKIDTVLVSDVYDSQNNLIWSKWNIEKNIVLTIPWLKFNRDKIFAKSKSSFTWWLNPKVHILTEEELKKFEWIILEKTKTKALELIREKIKTMNTNSESNFQIIPIDNIVKYYSWTTTILNNVQLWAKIDEITLRWNISATTYLYDKNSLISYLKTILNESLLTWTEKIIWINKESLKITNILSKTENPFYMKATTELDSTISYNFEDENNNLTKKLKNLILNTTKKEATSILLNDSNIANVKIKFSPFWLTRISSYPDNIDFIIQK